MARQSTSAFAAGIASALLVTAPVGPSRNAAAAPECTAERGQVLIDEGSYKRAIAEFTCLIEDDPTEVEGYRGRIEAELLLGRYSDAVRDYTRVTAFVLPVHPDAYSTILAGYDGRLAAAPENVPALTGASFAHWYFFAYPAAIQVLDRLVDVRPDDLYGNLFRGSTRLLLGANQSAGAADLERAIALAPSSPDVRFIAADAFTYGQPDPERAFDEASRALVWGLNTPRVHAILGTAYMAFGDMAAAAAHFRTHIALVTTEHRPTGPLAARRSLRLDLVPGRTYQIPVNAIAGESLSITTHSHNLRDSILVLIAPDGSAVAGGDDYRGYLAGFKWVAEDSGIYLLQVTSFEAVSTGELVVARN